jgi:hypothetical protein
LCTKAVAAKDPEEVNLILSELQATIRQYTRSGSEHARWQFLLVAESSDTKGATPPKNRNSPGIACHSMFLHPWCSSLLGNLYMTTFLLDLRLCSAALCVFGIDRAHTIEALLRE